MKFLSDRLLRWLGAIFLILAIYFLASAFYIPVKAVIAQSLLELAWHKTLAGNSQVRPWPWARTWPIARLKVPELGIDQIVLEGDQGNSLAFAPGRNVKTFYDKSAGLTMISAHRDTHFRFLKNIRLGQYIHVQDETGAVKRYQVEDMQIVDSRQKGIRAPVKGHWLTLVTCYPFDALSSNGPLRYVVFAEAVKPDQVRLELATGLTASLI